MMLGLEAARVGCFVDTIRVVMGTSPLEFKFLEQEPPR